MPKKFRILFLSSLFIAAPIFLMRSAFAADAPGGLTGQAVDRGMTLWQLIVAGGSCMIFLGIISATGVASIIYHFINVKPEKLTPPDFTQTLLFLLEKKEYDKAISVCEQQPNMISAIALKGLAKLSKGKIVVEEAIQYEGKKMTEKLWQNLGYLGDMAVIAPMLGLLGTVLGMIQAFNYQAFKAGIVKPIPLAQGLAKAMITTAFGLIIAVAILVFYSYFRGKISTITLNAERASSEIVQEIKK